MGKKGKERVQVILECTEHKDMGCRELLGISLLRIEKYTRKT